MKKVKLPTWLYTIFGVIHCPDELEPVLAKIEHINDLKEQNYEINR